jgi:hypothetical protein
MERSTDRRRCRTNHGSQAQCYCRKTQGEVARRGAASFTKTALKNGLAMGLTVGQFQASAGIVA